MVLVMFKFNQQLLLSALRASLLVTSLGCTIALTGEEHPSGSNSQFISTVHREDYNPVKSLEQVRDVGTDYTSESATGWTPKPGWFYPKEAVAAANPIAAQAGLQILKNGGNALDAAICIQMVLTLVEPQSSGIGGGGFLMLAHPKGLVVFDGRETAPSTANEKLFLNSDGAPLDFRTAQLSPRAIGVPGIVEMLWQAHRHYGKLPWKVLIQPAINLSENGFPVSPRLFQLLQREKYLSQNAYARDYFYQPDLTPWPVGYILKNPELAKILTDIANQGSKAFYKGYWAGVIVNTVNAPNFGNSEERMSLEDLRNYKAVIKEPLCFETSPHSRGEQSLFKVCGAPPPASGTLAMAQIMGMLRYTPAENLPYGPDWLHYYTEAARLALADRARYVSDSTLDRVDESKTWQALISQPYLKERAKLIGDKKMESPEFGIPIELTSPNLYLKVGSMADQPEHGTSHISVMDSHGIAVAFTTSIESAFGAKRMVNSGGGLTGGFLLNSQLTDFSFKPQDASGRLIANRPGPGKRPRSSMSPTLVLGLTGSLNSLGHNDNKNRELISKQTMTDTSTWTYKNVVASLGSPGGSAIIHFTTQTLWAMLEWGMSPQEAINLAHFALNTPSGELVLEKDQYNEMWLNTLRARRQGFSQAPLTSGVQAIERVSGGLSGGADPRREGVVLGR